MEWTMQDFTEELAMEWLRKPCWSIAESVYLLGEGQVPVSKYAGYPLPPEFAGNAGGGMDSLIRAIQARKLQAIASVEGSIRGRFPVYSPEDVIRVAEAINFGNWQNWKSRLEAIKGADIKQSKAKAPQCEINQERQTEQEGGAPAQTKPNYEKVLSELFDPVGLQQLEKMFPCGKWAGWGKKAKEKGLDAARIGRAKYNPYLAAQWWLTNRKPEGWDLARVNRVLANNLPHRSRDSKCLVTGELE